jgi:energy-coupling factor transporter ATP-binding protein EcfA2
MTEGRGVTAASVPWNAEAGSSSVSDPVRPGSVPAAPQVGSPAEAGHLPSLRSQHEAPGRHEATGGGGHEAPGAHEGVPEAPGAHEAARQASGAHGAAGVHGGPEAHAAGVHAAGGVHAAAGGAGAGAQQGTAVTAEPEAAESTDETGVTGEEDAAGEEEPGGAPEPPGGEQDVPAGEPDAGGVPEAERRTGASRGRAKSAEPHVRVDARKLESALLTLRHPIVSVPMTLEAPGAEDARAERRKLLSQIDDYLLPRLRQSDAPILVALVGSTGAGKSTLMNSLAGKQVSATGIRRPTTNSPVLACHPADIHWFAENVFLPTLPRVRQKGLAMPGRDGLLVLAESEGMPRGVALLDTPDIDSVVQAHREFAHQFLDASDLWLFMTSARRYADAAVWELLQEARDRGAALSIVLSRVPPVSAPQLTAHFEALLDANGLTDLQRFIIAETVITDARLPAKISRPVRQWLEGTAAQEDRRVAVLTQTMAGVLDTFRDRIPALAGHVENQLTARLQLRSAAEGAYDAGLTELDETTRSGSLLRGEILARWQDFAGTGDLLRTLQVRGSRRPGRPRKRAVPARAQALKNAIHVSMQALVASLADRAAEKTVARWQQYPAGQALLAGIAAESPAGSTRSEHSGGVSTGGDQPGGDQPGADHGSADHGSDSTRSDHAASEQPGSTSTPAERATPGTVTSFGRSSPDLARRSAQAISAWQDHVMHLVQAENVTKRSIARVVSFDDESLALVLTIGILGYGADDTASSDEAGAAPQRLLTSLFGAGLLRDIGARARLDLHDRISLLFAEEMLRFIQIIDSAGAPDDSVPSELYQASYALEAAR